MNLLQRRIITLLAITVMAAMAGTVQLFVVPDETQAQGQVSTPNERPFKLPFAEPSGPDTWLMAQPYGNTTGAYRQRYTTYGASGGIHFGVDLSAPCGKEIVAIADGIVFAVDGPFGSPPHNLMIDHPQLGYASMYGHLLQVPSLKPGDVVKQGQVVALSGDTGETCYSRPHLHLEIRDLNHVIKYNPATLIEANWYSLALTGSAGRDFARDLEEPRKWQSLYDQPQASTGGPIINDFDYAWPFDWRQRDVAALMPPNSINAVSASIQAAAPLATLPMGRQITAGNCCTQPYWSDDSTQVRFIDQPGPDQPLGIWEIEVSQPEAGAQFITKRLGLYSPNKAYLAYPNPRTGVAVVERLADGQTWEIDTHERSLSFTPDSQHVVWTAYDDDAPSDNREEIMWLAKVDGSQAKVLFKARRTDPIAWLSNDELLMTRRISGSNDQELFILSASDGRQTPLLQLPQIRGLSLSPDKRYLVYYVTFEPEADQNGAWLLDLQQPQPRPQALPFFGTYRWRDNERLIYVPFDPEATAHNFYEYHVVSGQTRPLFPAGTGLTIANNDWRVSPDGRQIVLVAANGAELNGLWVLDLSQNS
jgi:hypothetical protein